MPLSAGQQQQINEAMIGATVLITGGAGFIGGHIGHRCIAAGAKVRVLDDLTGGFAENIAPGAELIRASVLDDVALNKAASGCAYVFHQAAMVSVPESVAKSYECMQVNVVGTERVLSAAKAAGVRRVMFAASAAAYGNNPTLPSSERHLPDSFSPYAMSKISGELLCQTFSRCYGLSTVALRYFNVFGERQNPNSAYAAVISAFHQALTAGTTPKIFGDGQQTRDFVYIENVVNANLLAATCVKPLSGEIINIGTGQRVSLLTVLERMAEALGKPAKPEFHPARAGDIRDSVADISAAAELIGYHPVVDFATGINRMLACTNPTTSGAASSAATNQPRHAVLSK